MSIDSELFEAIYGLSPRVQKLRAEGRLPMPGEKPVRVEDTLREAFAAFTKEAARPPEFEDAGWPGAVEPDPEPEPDPVLVVQLEACLQQHDWYFDYSDDATVYRRGSAERDRIYRLVGQLGPLGDELLRKYQP